LIRDFDGSINANKLVNDINEKDSIKKVKWKTKMKNKNEN
jgi:hypothetical protein